MELLVLWKCLLVLLEEPLGFLEPSKVVETPQATLECLLVSWAQSQGHLCIPESSIHISLPVCVCVCVCVWSESVFVLSVYVCCVCMYMYACARERVSV